MDSKKSGPLAGMRVIELGHVMAGPTCGLMLADMGAEVIKVEKINGGDDTRRFVPPEINGESAAFMTMNRNKRGIALNLKVQGAVDVLQHMLSTADVVIENFRVGVMERLGLDYESLVETNPKLIMASISAYGRTGPYAERGGFDLVAQGLSGLMSITGDNSDGPPVKVGSPICDITAGFLLTIGVVAAYSHCLKTGQGQRVDTSIFEAGIAQTYWQSAITLATGESPRPMGSAHPLSAPYQAIRTKDGYINIGAANERTWTFLVTALNAPHFGTDSRFRTNSDRMANRAELISELEVHFASRTSKEWLEILNEAGVPAGPIYTIKEMLSDPQTIARDMVVGVDHPTAGRVRTIGSPIKFAATPTSVPEPAPRLGEHTREVLLEYGYTDADVNRLIQEEAINSFG